MVKEKYQNYASCQGNKINKGVIITMQYACTYLAHSELDS